MEPIQFKDVAHLYKGCVMQHSGDQLETTYPILTGWLLDRLNENFKPVLLKILDITDAERKEIYKLAFKRDSPESGTTVFREDRTLQSEPRWVLSTGVDRLGIETNGTVWVDCDLHPYKHNQHEITLFLLKRGFDLFGLIESGQAVDATTLTPNP